MLWSKWHLTISDENYNVALDILKNNYLNVSLCIDTVLTKISETPKLKERDWRGIRRFLGESRIDVTEITAPGVGCETEGTGGSILLSQEIRRKLPSDFLIELRNRTSKNYPSLSYLAALYPCLKTSLYPFSL